MSHCISQLRDTLARLVDAAELVPVVSDRLAQACRKARRVLHATRFVAPAAFPARLCTRSGAIVTLHALHDGRLIGSYVDGDGLQLHSWAPDGTLFGPDDVDDFDLVGLTDAVLMPEDAPVPDGTEGAGIRFGRRQPRHAVPCGDGSIIEIPFLGRVS